LGVASPLRTFQRGRLYRLVHAASFVLVGALGRLGFVDVAPMGIAIDGKPYSSLRRRS